MIFLLSVITLVQASSLKNNFDLGYSDCTQSLKNKIVRIDSEGLRRGAGNIMLGVFYLRDCGESLCPERMEEIRPWRTMYGNKIRADEKAEVLLVHDLKICCSPNCFTNTEDIYGDCMLYREEREAFLSAGEDGEVGVEEYNHQHRDLYRWRIEVQGNDTRGVTSATKLTLVIFLVTVVFLSLLLSMSSCYG